MSYVHIRDETPAVLGYHAGCISVKDIKAAVCEAFDIPLIEMVSERRARPVARPRQVAMYLSRKLTPYSLPNIGRFFGDRDHTTVMHAITKVESLMGEDPAFKDDVEAVTSRLIDSVSPIHSRNDDFSTSVKIPESA